MYKKIIVIFSIILLSGCTTYHGLKPLSPQTTGKTLETKPYFQWQASEKEGVKYDFTIYELVVNTSFSWKAGTQVLPMPGKTIYYKEGLDLPEHTINLDLEPGVKYLWAVRVRDGETVEPWSKYDFFAYFVFGHVSIRNHLFEIEIIDPNKKVTTSKRRGRFK